jgi:hypothetical protein
MRQSKKAIRQEVVKEIVAWLRMCADATPPDIGPPAMWNRVVIHTGYGVANAIERKWGGQNETTNQ